MFNPLLIDKFQELTERLLLSSLNKILVNFHHEEPDLPIMIAPNP
jgi:hypothetical protein